MIICFCFVSCSFKSSVIFLPAEPFWLLFHVLGSGEKTLNHIPDKSDKVINREEISSHILPKNTRIHENFRTFFHVTAHQTLTKPSTVYGFARFSTLIAICGLGVEVRWSDAQIKGRRKLFLTNLSNFQEVSQLIIKSKKCVFARKNFLNSEDDIDINFEELLNRILNSFQRCPILN